MQLKAVHIAGKKNYLAFRLSRSILYPTEWILNTAIAERIFLGTTSDRSLCDKSKQKDNTILQVVIPSTSVCNIRIISRMGPNLCIRFSTYSSDTMSSVSHDTIPVSDHSNRTTLAKEVLVSSVTGNSHSKTNSTSCSGQSIITGRDPLSQCKKSQPDCMAIINKQFATKGFS
ncbi:hypothetical protein DPMN_013579 [Dreissena polymorpha]|uniref:Uncharacterized protein n=1 Tax=Dreissena polymorpha TaxID=45954 RepID=A0A9D4N4H8_DREPO|nr:hypothetical protein DPMN_013579 [Dreissena polymorpha]